MKILFVGSTKGFACSLHYYTSLVRLGHSVLPYDPDFFQTRGFFDKLAVRISKSPKKRVVDKAHRALVDLCRHNQFDMVFVMAENFIRRETLEAMQDASPRPPVLMYHSHDNNFSSGILKPNHFFSTLNEYDLVFTTKSQNVERYKSLGQQNSFFIPSAYEPAVHHPVLEQDSRYRKSELLVTFVGTYDRSRDPILEKVGWDRLQVWGSHWQRSPHFPKHKDHIHPNPIYYFEFADVLSSSACSLGLLRAEAEDLHTQRTFEIPACGALQFSPRTDEILSFFEEDKEIVCFSSAEELKDKLDYYLRDESARRKVAEAGHRRCVDGKHAYIDRVRSMIQLAAPQLRRTHG